MYVDRKEHVCFEGAEGSLPQCGSEAEEFFLRFLELFDVLAAGRGEETEGFKCRGSFDAVDSDRDRVGAGENLEFAWVVIDGCK